MYFAVLWKNMNISLRELQLVNPINIKKQWIIVYFDCEKPEYLSLLWWITKWWEITQLWEVTLENVKIIWVNDDKLWLFLKRSQWVKRYKLTDVVKTDLDVKKDGVEVIAFDDHIHAWTKVWVVKWYQNISLFEEVDFGKPARGMEIWMMPAKLTQIMLNIWVSEYLKLNWELKIENWELTIYDPFAWFGTTGFIANALWYHFIWSDINITPFKQNIKWWESSKFYNDKKFTIFKHDIKEGFKKDFLKNVDVLVTEGRLGPVVKKDPNENEFVQNMKLIDDIYSSYVKHIDDFYDKIINIFTIPVYIWKDNYIKDILTHDAEWKNYTLEFVEEIYSRKGQKVGRQIVVMSKN